MNHYEFNKVDRIGTDLTDSTQQNVQNTRFANYSMTTYFSDTISKDNMQFVAKQPTMNMGGTVYGNGINGQLIDNDSQLTIKKIQDRTLEKLSLNQRQFLTIPYLGRGSCDTTKESHLLQGLHISDKKSTMVESDGNFSKYILHPDEGMHEKVEAASYNVQESVLPEWRRGGMNSRYQSI